MNTDSNSSEAVTPGGSKNKAGVGAIEQLERKLQVNLVERQDDFHYDELCGFSDIGQVFNRIKPVRNEHGEIDVYSTFMKVRNRQKTSGGGF